ncbi:unnamed protein product [Lactuca virosa]|uniref:Uncharacterized protein n=1 Tax=Lactuca virosa TaxID=75947 RepID=A0AAU9PKR9_9ASTR|nr:unnamed protein product [Lactuca virosa]
MPTNFQRNHHKIVFCESLRDRPPKLQDNFKYISSQLQDSSQLQEFRVFGIERDKEELRKKLYSEMKKVVGLTVRDCNKAVRMLSKNDELMVIFFTVEDEDNLEWVKDLLEDDA